MTIEKALDSWISQAKEDGDRKLYIRFADILRHDSVDEKIVCIKTLIQFRENGKIHRFSQSVNGLHVEL